MFCRTVCIVTQDYHAFIKGQNQKMIVKFQCKPVEFYLPFINVHFIVEVKLVLYFS